MIAVIGLSCPQEAVGKYASPCVYVPTLVCVCACVCVLWLAVLEPTAKKTMILSQLVITAVIQSLDDRS